MEEKHIYLDLTEAIKYAKKVAAEDMLEDVKERIDNYNETHKRKLDNDISFENFERSIKLDGLMFGVCYYYGKFCNSWRFNIPIDDFIVKQ